MQLSTQQMFFFVNHGLQPKFDIQNKHKVMNEDWAMWLSNVRTQFISNLEKTQRWYNFFWMNSKRNNPISRSGTWLGFNNNVSKQQNHQRNDSSKVRSIFHCETNQCYGFPTQTSSSYENPSYVSCFLIGTLPHIYQSKKNPWSPSTYWNQWWTRIWSGKHFGFKDPYSLAWVWCEQIHLKIN